MSYKVSTTSKRLKKLIDETQINQAELAKMCNVSKSMISSYVNGKYEPKQDTLTKLSQIFKVSEIWLLGYDTPKEITNVNELYNSGNGVQTLTIDNKTEIKTVVDFDSQSEFVLDLCILIEKIKSNPALLDKINSFIKLI